MKSFRSACLKDVAESFNWNLVRTSTFALMPAWIALEAVREQLWLDYAASKHRIPINPELTEYATDVLSDKKQAAVAEDFSDLVESYRMLPEETMKRLIKDIGVNFIEHAIPTSKGIAVSVEIIFESIVRESWTAFEDLLRELWVVLLNNDDGTLANRVARAIEKPRKKIIPTYNLKTHPGSFHVETKQVVFQTFKDIERFYRALFGPSGMALFDTVEAGYIRVLYAFRNVLVHRRGKADLTFKDQVANYPEFNKIKLDEQIALDGNITRKMRDAAMVLGRKLIELADEELQRQKP